jgi:hypothetical protein
MRFHDTASTMKEKPKQTSKYNQYITIILVAAIIISICVIAYVNFIPKSGEPTDEEISEPAQTLLTVTYDSHINNYSRDDLTSFVSTTGIGSYINRAGKITGPINYTGVQISVLLDEISDLPGTYTVHVVAVDGYTVNYSLDEINGNVPIYNETGNETGVGNLTMIIAYQAEGQYLNETTDGPLRVAFVDETGTITHSSLWLRSLVRIDII